MKKEAKDAGSKRNIAGGEQVHFSQADKNSKWACEFWVAGSIAQKIDQFSEPQKSEIFAETRWRF